MKIKVLGTGCAKCKKLESVTREAAKNINLDCNIEKVEGLNDIMSYGVMVTPALVIDEKVISTGKLYSIKEMEEILQKN